MLRLLSLPLAFAVALAGLSPAAAHQHHNHGDPDAPFFIVAELNLERYAGHWYEIARFPNRHQRNCNAIMAEYSTRRDGNFDVRGTCPDRRPGRDRRTMEGVARLDGPAELSIGLTSWMPLFRRTVFVLGISEDYQVAVVGEPSRRYGWIMARSQQISPAQFDRAAQVLARNGYRIEYLEHLVAD